MKEKKLNTRQQVVRALFVIAAVVLIGYSFPHAEVARYQYELGKPWHYETLQAEFSFPVSYSDSVYHQMEDSIRRSILPVYSRNQEAKEAAREKFRKEHFFLGNYVYRHFCTALDNCYDKGFLSAQDKESLLNSGFNECRVEDIAQDLRLQSSESLLSDADVYKILSSDTTGFAINIFLQDLQDYIIPNLTLDTLAMEREYAAVHSKLRREYKIIQKEQRIVDQGQVITASIYRDLECYEQALESRYQESGNGLLMWGGQLVIIILLMVSLVGFLYFFRHWHHVDHRYTLLAIVMVVIMVLLTSLLDRLMDGGVYLAPICITTIVLATFHGSRTAFWYHIIMSLLCAFIAPAHFEYFVVQCIVGVGVVFCLRDGMTQRSHLLRVCGVALVLYPLSYCAEVMATQGTLEYLNENVIYLMFCNSLLLMMSYLIIYALEKLFGFMSGVTLVELCNLGQGLLLQLSKEAPGTFQHSLQVANLTAAAAEAIGANAQLVRTGSLYHDIGKLWNPLYYTENQQGGNPHDGLSVEESVAIIKRHVTEGLALAKKENLPEGICRFIATHHGASFIKYFYINWCNSHPGEEPDRQLFAYPGPDPESREEALLMMGDGIEAASKSLKTYDEETFRQLVNRIVDGLVADGRLNRAKITLRDIQTAKESFIRGLESIYHARIAYPELKTDKG